MKTFLLTVALCAAVTSAAPQKKRDISHLIRSQDVNNKYVPFQKYYQEYQQPQQYQQEHQQPQQYHQEHDQPRQYSQEYQQPQTSNQYLAPAVKALPSEKRNYQFPATNYGVPINAAPAPAPVPVARNSVQVATSGLVTSYGTPVADDAVAIHSTCIDHAPQVYQAPTAVSHQSYSTKQSASVHSAPVSAVHQAPVPIIHKAPVPVVHSASFAHQAPESIFSAPLPELSVHTEDKYYIFHRTAPALVVHQEIHPAHPMVHPLPESIFSEQVPQLEQEWNLDENFNFQAPLQFVDGFENLDDHRIPPAPVTAAPAPVENVQDDAVVVDAAARSSIADSLFKQPKIRSGAGYVH